LDRILALRPTGLYSDPASVRGTLHTYEHARQGAIRLKNYWDAAYIEGYQNGLMTLEIDPEVAYNGTPRYFVWGHKDEMHTVSEYLAALRKAESLHKGAVQQARRLVGQAGGMDVLHTPFLNIPKLAAASNRGATGRRTN
jgi:hypothetical protein